MMLYQSMGAEHTNDLKDNLENVDDLETLNKKINILLEEIEDINKTIQECLKKKDFFLELQKSKELEKTREKLLKYHLQEKKLEEIIYSINLNNEERDHKITKYFNLMELKDIKIKINNGYRISYQFLSIDNENKNIKCEIEVLEKKKRELDNIIKANAEIINDLKRGSFKIYHENKKINPPEINEFIIDIAIKQMRKEIDSLNTEKEKNEKNIIIQLLENYKHNHIYL